MEPENMLVELKFDSERNLAARHEDFLEGETAYVVLKGREIILVSKDKVEAHSYASLVGDNLIEIGVLYIGPQNKEI